MGDQVLEKGADGQSTYSVIAFPGASLPQAYQNMVYAKWMRSLKYGNEYFKLADPDSFFSAYKRYIGSILARPRSVVRIAVLSDDHDVALGWSIIEGDVLHYVHVNHEQRNKGVGKTLVPVAISTITHLTKAGAAIWNSKLRHASFNPFR
jgi:hypothetical protein